jgi:uncharacterized protein YjbJ (UPF0337 family)
MDDNKRQQVEGHVNEVKGKAKEQLGRARNDDNQVTEGQADQVEANVQQGIGKLKDKGSDVAEKVTR